MGKEALILDIRSAYARGAITASERAELIAAVKRAESYAEASRIVSGHARGRSNPTKATRRAREKKHTQAWANAYWQARWAPDDAKKKRHYKKLGRKAKATAGTGYKGPIGRLNSAKRGVKKSITYTYRGQIERADRRGSYKWHNGYSEGTGDKVSYPWMTRAECQADARSRGAKAIVTGLRWNSAKAKKRPTKRRRNPTEYLIQLYPAKKLDSGGYDRHGRYYGRVPGTKIYEYVVEYIDSSGAPREKYSDIRAYSRAAAKSDLRREYPGAKISR